MSSAPTPRGPSLSHHSRILNLLPPRSFQREISKVQGDKDFPKVL